MRNDDVEDGIYYILSNSLTSSSTVISEKGETLSPVYKDEAVYNKFLKASLHTAAAYFKCIFHIRIFT